MNPFSLNDKKEKGIFFQKFFLTLAGFAIVATIQIVVIMEQFEPRFVLLPLLVSSLVGYLFGHNAVLRHRLVLSSQAKSDFLSRMSHEFRTPLTSIIGFSQYLRHNGDLDSETIDQAARIHKAGQHLLGLVEDLLQLAQLEAGKIRLDFESACLAEQVRDAVQMIEPVAKKRGITVDNRVDEHPDLLVRVDTVRFRQILMNLLSNAVKYNRDNGCIVLSLEQTSQAMIRINIIDTGHGIEPEYIPLLFDYFYRLESDMKTVEGTGIGLAISRQLVEIMHGEIGVISEPGRGSTFWLEFPVMHSDATK
ncbi:MAG: HAMP domain-containing histidine kinase [Gammaproteobacteria bacterium]|nr:HAMP domain-containing histidine kinase [Gammaproteobacteria bacterium]